MAKRRIDDNRTLKTLIVFFGLLSLFSGAKVLTTQGEQPKPKAA